MYNEASICVYKLCSVIVYFCWIIELQRVKNIGHPVEVNWPEGRGEEEGQVHYVQEGGKQFKSDTLQVCPAPQWEGG